jgi:hypothetical protein
MLCLVAFLGSFAWDEKTSMIRLSNSTSHLSGRFRTSFIDRADLKSGDVLSCSYAPKV